MLNFSTDLATGLRLADNTEAEFTWKKTLAVEYTRLQDFTHTFS